MRRLLRIQFVRFLLVGTLNTGFSYGIYALCLWLGLHFVAANLVALLLGVVFSFGTQGRLVFHNADPRRFLQFTLFWAVIWGCNIGLIRLLMEMGLGAYAAGALALVPVTLLSYVGQKLFVFAPARRPRSGSDAHAAADTR